MADRKPQLRFQRDVLPVVVSVALHAGLLVAGWGVYRSITPYVTVVRDQIIVPDAAIVARTDTRGVPELGLSSIAHPPSGVEVEAFVAGQSIGERSQISANALLGAASDGELIGIGLGIGAVRISSGVAGGGDGTATPFGVPGGDAPVPRSPFMGVIDNAYRVAYICDTSGTMVTVKSLLKQNLGQAIDALKPTQSFNIFFFTHRVDPAAPGFIAFNPSQLIPATPQNKQLALGENGWIEKTYSVDQDAEPTAAIRAAMAQEPRLVYLLTGGLSKFVDPQRPQKVRQEIARLNAARKVRINTIYILMKGTAGQQPMQAEIDANTAALQAIARESGGSFKIIRIQE